MAQPSFRKLRTRTLIQLGGLVEKAGLLPPLDIAQGADLQKDEEIKDSVAVLLGGLLGVKDSLADDTQKRLFLLKGKQAFKKERIN